MKSKSQFIAVAIVFLIACGVAAGATKKLAVIKGKPAVAFIGTIKSIATNTLPYQIVVDGASNSDAKDAPKGKVTFDVQASCRIKAADGKSRGAFSDLKADQRVGISYAGKPGAHFSAESIDLDPPTPEKKK